MDAAISPSAITTTVFEHPLSESIRICLRLETLFNQLHQITNNNTLEPLSALSILLRIINTTDRPDFHAKLGNTLTRLNDNLSLFDNISDIDQEKLSTLRTNLHQLNHDMQQNNHRIADNLKKIDFIHQLRRQLQQPAGLSPQQYLPLKAWLDQDTCQQQHDLAIWQSKIQDLENSILVIFNILRQQKKEHDCQTKNGFFQHSACSNEHHDLLRIIPHHNSAVYPKISVGHHGLSLHFIEPNYHQSDNAKTVTDEVKFTLQYCKII